MTAPSIATRRTPRQMKKRALQRAKRRRAQAILRSRLPEADPEVSPDSRSGDRGTLAGSATMGVAIIARLATLGFLHTAPPTSIQFRGLLGH